MESDKVHLNKGQDNELELEGYKRHRGRQLLTFIGYLLSVGLLRLLFYWLPHLHLWATSTRCDLGEAERVLTKDHFNQRIVSTVRTVTREGTGIKIKRPRRFGNRHSSHVFFDNQARNDSSIIRYFMSKKTKYIWDVETQSFLPLKGLDEGYTLSSFHNTQGLTLADQAKRRILYGSNSIAVHVTPIIKLLFKGALSPFYVFQLFSMCVWYADDYYIYATCIAVMTTVSLVLTIYQTRTFEKALRNTITSTTTVTVCRGEDGEYEDISSEDLVPGDVIEIPRHGCDMQCDAVLVTGNCILNESMLTGESVPVTKTSLSNPAAMAGHSDPQFDIKQHTRHVLYNGTHVIQTRFYGSQRVKAVVLRTGFSTSKGELVRSIMFPKPVDFKFQRHSYYFILVLAFLACMGFIYTVVLMIHEGEDPSLIVLRTLDLITITIPPALPAALAVGVVFSQKRLKNLNVYCISPKGITICGTIDAVCFDKTGTLTEEGLDMHGVVPVSEAKFETLEKEASRLPNCPLITAMATCHSLTIIHNQVMGDPLDLIMFHATNWDLEEPGEDETRFDNMTPTVVKPKGTSTMGNSEWSGDVQPQGCDVGIVRQFPFSSSLQRMSVVTRKLGSSQFELYVKGSPEMISSLSKPDTVPDNFHDQLQVYTEHGYRVIGLAWKPLPTKLSYVKMQKITRDTVENELIFLGLLIMENRLKPITAPVIATLTQANIRTIMVTGDNMLTALSVARECGIVAAVEKTILVQAYPPEKGQTEVPVEFVEAHSGESRMDACLTVMDEDNFQTQEEEENRQNFHLAVTGKVWETIHKHCPALLKKLVVKGTVFARMAPEQKGQLVEVLQDVGYYVGMCGDGANDCSALKTAHMGISLSEAEASVASPFTSKTPTIECVPRVIREGRAALTTSFGVFKYMALYSLTQFVSVLILYWPGANLTDPQFLYIDLFIITSMSITFSWTGPYPKLVKDRPMVSLISPGPILSILTQAALVIGIQTFAFVDVHKQAWFLPYTSYDEEEESYKCHENTAIFLSSIYLYSVLALTFSKGAPFRNSIFSNRFLLVNVVVVFCANIWITIYPTHNFAEFMELDVFPSIRYRAVYFALAIVSLLVSIVMEKYIIDNDSLRSRLKTMYHKWRNYQGSMYQIIESEIDNNPHWPPVSETKVNLADIFQRLDSQNQTPPNLRDTKNTLDQILEDSGQESQESSTNQISAQDSNNDLEQLLKKSDGTGVFFDEDGAVNTAL